jgi:hypothetical protein
LAVGLNQDKLHPWYPAYRRGRLTQEQVAEGLADRYWDARLLRDEEDPNMVIAGITVFEWNDEWHKVGNPDSQADDPEEHFGVSKFIDHPNKPGHQLRYKLQQETIRDLYTLGYDEEVSIIKSVTADLNSLPVGGVRTVGVELSDEVAHPVRLRWESDRGYITGDASTAVFYVGDVALGPASITFVAIDANGNVDSNSITIGIDKTGDPYIEILTLGTQKASGRINNVNINDYKVICALYDDWNNWFDFQPYQDQFSRTGVGMKSIWVDESGYWWTKVWNGPSNDLYCWLVDKNLPTPDRAYSWELPDSIAEANTVNMDTNDYNDGDNDLLPDWWEQEYFDSTQYDRYDDPDGDMGNNLEEFLAGMNPNDPNDDDKDGLWDNWERHYFGNISIFDANDNPDNDGLDNRKEIELELHPGRSAADTDRDGLPDLWEIRWFGNYDPNTDENPDGDCHGNLEEYELGLDPTRGEGDMDCDYGVNYRDFALLRMHWLEDHNDSNWCDKVDLNRDGEASLPDVRIMGGNWLMDP